MTLQVNVAYVDCVPQYDIKNKVWGEMHSSIKMSCVHVSLSVTKVRPYVYITQCGTYGAYVTLAIK